MVIQPARLELQRWIHLGSCRAQFFKIDTANKNKRAHCVKVVINPSKTDIMETKVRLKLKNTAKLPPEATMSKISLLVIKITSCIVSDGDKNL